MSKAQLNEAMSNINKETYEQLKNKIAAERERKAIRAKGISHAIPVGAAGAILTPLAKQSLDNEREEIEEFYGDTNSNHTSAKPSDSYHISDIK